VLVARRAHDESAFTDECPLVKLAVESEADDTPFRRTHEALARVPGGSHEDAVLRLVADDRLLRSRVRLERAVQLYVVGPERRHDGDTRARVAEREVGARQLEDQGALPLELGDQRAFGPEVPREPRRGNGRVDACAPQQVGGERRCARLPRRPRDAHRPITCASEDEAGEARHESPRSAKRRHARRDLRCPAVEERGVGAGIAVELRATDHTYGRSLREQKLRQRLRLRRGVLDRHVRSGQAPAPEPRIALHAPIVAPHTIELVEIRPFAIERFYERWEFAAELMLSSSDCESVAVSDLLALEPDAEQRLRVLRLGYTEVAGSDELRAAVAAQYSSLEPADILTLAAAEEGIFVGYHALLRPGDHAVVEAPCYGSALEVARSTGADVTRWERRHEDRWAYDVDELERLLRPETRLLYVNSPHNPTGSHMTHDVQERIVELAREHELVLFSDEVYRGLEHDPAGRLPAACDLYERAISLGTVSKAHGLPGLRTGWIASRDRDLLDRATGLKLYTTICSSAPSELLVALALRHADSIVERNRQLVLANLPLVDDFLSRWPRLFTWVRPVAGPIGFPRVSLGSDVHAWCEEIASRSGVLLLPGTVYDVPDHVRFGFGRVAVPEALERLDDYLREGAPVVATMQG
jgi:aspartate/methionine/tyrosine aminotransferase